MINVWRIFGMWAPAEIHLTFINLFRDTPSVHIWYRFSHQIGYILFLRSVRDMIFWASLRIPHCGEFINEWWVSGMWYPAEIECVLFNVIRYNPMIHIGLCASNKVSDIFVTSCAWHMVYWTTNIIPSPVNWNVIVYSRI